MTPEDRTQMISGLTEAANCLTKNVQTLHENFPTQTKMFDFFNSRITVILTAINDFPENPEAGIKLLDASIILMREIRVFGLKLWREKFEADDMPNPDVWRTEMDAMIAKETKTLAEDYAAQPKQVMH